MIRRMAWSIAALFGRAAQVVIVAIIAVAIIATPFAIANYTATQGTGTTFASVVISSTHYFAQLICDATVGQTQCAAVNSSGQIAIQAPPTLPLPTSASTSANQTSQITQETASATALGVPNSAASCVVSSTTTALQCLFQIDADVKGSVAAGTNIVGKFGIDQTTPGTTNAVVLTSQYPGTAIPITASATGTTGATTATLAAAASGHTTYICSYSIRANATAAATVTDTITGVITATMSSILWVAPLASGLGVDEQIFSPCVPASATATAIAVVSGAPGSGGTVSVHATGYQL